MEDSLSYMEINRVKPAKSRLKISNQSVRQARLFMKSEMIPFVHKTKCCGVYRRNSAVSDPGFYLNGGPSCSSQSLECNKNPDRTIQAIGDSLVPGSFVYAPKTTDRFFPAMVDICPDGEGHFVIFKNGGRLCCSPYAYYLTFLPDCEGKMLQGWFAAELIVPLDTANKLGTDTPYNINCGRFHTALKGTRDWYFNELRARMLKYSVACTALTLSARRIRRILRPAKFVGGMLATQARRLSSGFLSLLEASDRYVRYDGEENGSADPPIEPASLLASFLRRFSCGSGRGRAAAERAAAAGRDRFDFMLISDLAQGLSHIHPEQEVAPYRRAFGTGGRLMWLVNFTKHHMTAVNEILRRSAILATMQCGEIRIRIHREDV